MSEQLQIKQANTEMDSCDLATAWLQRSVTSLQGQKSQQTASRPVLGAVTKKETLCHNMGLASRGASATFHDMGFCLRGNKACNMLPCPLLQQNTFRRQEFAAPKLGLLHGLFDRCSSEARPPSNLLATCKPRWPHLKGQLTLQGTTTWLKLRAGNCKHTEMDGCAARQDGPICKSSHACRETDAYRHSSWCPDGQNSKARPNC